MKTSPMRPRGFTLIEFMIAMTLSLIVLAALTGAFVSNSRARAEIERANQQIENGRFALQLLGDDLELAGFLGTFDVKIAETTAGWNAATAKPNPCVTAISTTVPPAAASLNAAFTISIQGYDNIATATPVTCVSGAVGSPGTELEFAL